MPEVLNVTKVVTILNILRSGEWVKEGEFDNPTGLYTAEFVTILAEGDQGRWEVVNMQMAYDRVKKILYHSIYLEPK